MTDSEFMKQIEKVQRHLKHAYGKDVQINVGRDIDLLIDDVTVAYFKNAVNTKLRFTQLVCEFSATEILPIINRFNDRVSNLIREYGSEL